MRQYHRLRRWFRVGRGRSHAIAPNEMDILGAYVFVHLSAVWAPAIWHGPFEALGGLSQVHGGHGMASTDATHVRAHRSAAGAKGGLRREHRPLARRLDDKAAWGGRPAGWAEGAVALLPQDQRHRHGRALVEVVGPARRLVGDRGYDANHLRDLHAARSTAAVVPSTTSHPLRRRCLRGPQRFRVHLAPPQGLAPDRNML